jgi:hypothetical protein
MRRTRSTFVAVLQSSLVLLAGCGVSDEGSDVSEHEASPPAPEPTAKGDPTGTKVTQRIGAAGGTLRSGDGALTVSFPLGAVSGDTEIGIEPITNHAPLGIAGAFRLTPDGAIFDQPVKLTFVYTDQDLLGSSVEALGVAYQDAEGLWRRIGPAKVDPANHTLTIETKHFTDFTRVYGWQISPASASISPQASQELELKFCEPEIYEDANGGDSLASLIPVCEGANSELRQLVRVRGWSVNGRKGGSLGDGTVNDRGQFATYLAPGLPPDRNPVAVSVEFDRGKGTNLAVANILIGPAGWNGEVSWQVSGESVTNDPMTTTTTRVSGNGRILVRPGKHGLGEAESGLFNYTWTQTETTSNQYKSMGCNISLIQNRAQRLQGEGTEGAVIYIQETSPGVANLTIGLPHGETKGTITTKASEVHTGEVNCKSPQPTDSSSPIEGSIPTGMFVFDAKSRDGVFSGSQTLEAADESPPHQYTFTYNLSKQ